MKKEIKISVLLLSIFAILLISACETKSQTIVQEEKAVEEKKIISYLNRYTGPRVDTLLRLVSPVREMFEDSKGNFWFGTNSEGLVKFDGKYFTYYTIYDGLCDNQIRSIKEDEKGNIWLGTGKGVSSFDGLNFKTWTKEIHSSTMIDEIPELLINWSIDSNDLWFNADTKNGTFRYDGKALQYLSFPIPKNDSLNFMPHNYAIYSILKDRENNVWFGTLNKGVIHFDGHKFNYLNEQQLNVPVRCIFQDKKGDMWFGNNGGGVFHYDGKKLVNLTDKFGLGNPAFLKGEYKNNTPTLARVWDIEQDEEGHMWFATVDAGVWKYDGKAIINVSLKSKLTDPCIDSIYKDKNGMLWFGTGHGAVYFYNGESFVLFSDDNC